ncbi:hypothetical protein F8R89_30855 [Streptomyces sp. SS1-1]|uniref:hypothetical protein n=1 Tax=Streptomyces sp. SS1-1 TaxID=2651869 RepID=UPI001250B74B|nr:hypothetical protein [Streptomyces sp. SS1-1]KAB2976009.1 hypothetical protein F8R89_30855 [Streptomyces sp. SS1-1]
MTTDPTSEQLAALVRDFLDPDPCALDHHGYCQAHSWLCEGRCPHARAREVLAEYDAQQAASAGLGVSATPSHTDQAALRESIAEALLATPREGWTYETGREKWDHHKHGDRPGHTYSISCALCTGDVTTLADAVLAVLPPPADRAAVLREAADRMSKKASALTEGLHDLAHFVAKDRLREAEILDREADELRRLADETQPPEPVVTVHAAPDLSPAAAEALAALADVAKQQIVCDFDHPHPEHPCGRRLLAPVDEAPQQPDTEAWDVPDARPGTTDYTLTRPAADAQSEPPVHGESVAHLAGLHDGHDQCADGERGIVHRCTEFDTWFDRTVCAEPCGAMHTRCVNCGAALDTCPQGQPAVDARQDGAQQ